MKKTNQDDLGPNDAPIIHLGALLRSGEDAHLEGEVAQLHYDQGGARTLKFTQPAPYRIDVNDIGGEDMYLQGRFQPTLELECARCLRPVEVPLDLDLGMILRYDHTAEEPYIDAAESGEELLLFGEPQLDLSSYLAETALVNTPLVVLHSPDCKGLCQVCGQDLNEALCEHVAIVPIEAEDVVAAQARQGNNPFAALQDLDLPEGNDD